MMYMIPWSDILPEHLVESTLEDNIQVWDEATTYLVGQLVYGSDEETVYECAVGPATFSQGQYCGQEFGENLDNVGNDPEENPTVPAMDRLAYPDYYEVADCYAESGKLWWIKRGKYWENKYRMFSETPDDVSIGPESETISSFTFTIKVPEHFRVLGFARLDATSIRVVTGDIDKTFDLVTPAVETLPAGDTHKSFVAVLIEDSELGVFVPANQNVTITVIHDKSKRRYYDPVAPVTAKLGYIVLGFLVKIGLTLYGSTVGIIDYSKKERDAFGRADVLARNFTSTVRYRISIPTNQIYSVREFLAASRAYVTMYVGDLSLPETIVVGYFKNFSIPIEAFSDSVFDLEVEGL